MVEEKKPEAAAPAAPAVDPREAARQRRIAREKELATKLAEKLGAAVKGRSSFRDQESMTVEREKALEALRICKEELGYDVLMDVTGVDYLKLSGEHPERFAVVWNLLSMSHEARLRIKTYLPEEEPVIGTACGLWAAANWGEREAYDMYGIEFKGHPNLKRILMPDDYGSFPLRKDYPLRGRGERDNFVVLKRGQKEIDA